jgi:hypothetical protein
MDNLTGLVAVTMLLGMPTAAFATYTFYRVRKLRSQERMAAIARGITVPMAPDLTEADRSRRSGILLVAGAIGYMITFTLIARVEPDAWIAASTDREVRIQTVEVFEVSGYAEPYISDAPRMSTDSRP